ncbi:MAG: 30S ribosomal protein S4 [Patescibacteria group bacterium]|nr:30S ribosomal protein S4 [Patescibacteria group bacterium]
MATDPKCRKCRREQEKLFLKGDKCYTKCTLVKRNYAPGQHGLSRRGKPSDYSVMLREKQKVKRIYGLRESQFKSYFEKAARKQGITGELLLSILESRLDNTVFRMGFATSRAQARQLVSHGIFAVNGRKVDIPSIILKPGDKVAVIPGKKKKKYFEDLLAAKPREDNSWVKVDRKNLAGEFVSAPIREQLDPSINEQLIVEFYSK